MKSDPARWDIADFLRDEKLVESWSISDTYRQHLVLPGQPVFLYVIDNDRGVPAGIYGVGEIDDEPFVGAGDERWSSVIDRVKKHIFVPLDMPPLRLLATSQSLRIEPALAHLELFVAPSPGNPVLVRPQELAVLEGLCAG